MEWRKQEKFCALVLSTILLTGLRPSAGFAGWQLPNGTAAFTHANYDYAPSIIVSGNIEQVWWCGYGSVPGSSTMSDVIYYRTHNLSSGVYSNISQVLSPNPGHWDGVFTCDPSVIEGRFIDPDNGDSYGYAMYYTATNLPAGTQNSIGVAFSNDGITWEKYSGNPVIVQQVVNQSTYGAGQAATYSRDGAAGLYMFHTDTSALNQSRVYVRSTSDGIHFGTPTLVSNQATDGTTLLANADFAYDYNDGNFYSAIETAVRPGDRESYQFGIYKLNGAQVLAGQGSWQPIGYMSTALSGFYLNHSPGIVRDTFGNLSAPPTVSLLWGGGTNVPTTWDLVPATLAATPISAAFKRYYDNPIAKHLVTTGYVYPGYTIEEMLGYLYLTLQPSTAPLYSCTSGGYQFVSPAVACEGNSNVPQGILGYIYSSPPGNIATQALYRCYKASTEDHFVSPDPKCEGQTTELGGNPLGYAPTQQQ